MGHTVFEHPGAFVELRYSGPVTYEERMAAVDSVTAVLRDSGLRKILADYRDATVTEIAPGSRIDYIARAIASDVLQGCRVAMIGLSPEHMRAAEMAGLVRNIRLKGFDDRDEAIAWLTAAHAQ